MLGNSIWMYPAFIGTAISVLGLTWLAKWLYDPKMPRTLSEMATISPQAMLVFRAVTLPCSVLFALTSLLFIAPQTSLSFWISLAAILMCGSEIIVIIFPASGQSKLWHNILAYTMGFAMIGLAYLFAQALNGSARMAEYITITAMIIFAIGILTDRRRFIFYELPYIYLSHLSILIAVVSLH